MDNLGYRNWDNDDQSPNPPSYGSNDPYGFSDEMSPPPSNRKSKKNAQQSSSMYDYSIGSDEDDEYAMSPEPVTKHSGTRRENKFAASNISVESDDDKSYANSPELGSRRSTSNRDNKLTISTVSNPNRRKSTEERMKEILERNEAEKKKTKTYDDDNEGDNNTWKSTWDDLLAGMNSSPGASLQEDDSPLKSQTPGGMKRRNSTSELQSPTDSSFGDLDISASDLQVGAIAARRTQEKASDKIRKTNSEQTLYRATGTTFQSPEKVRPLQTSESPNIAQVQKPPTGFGGPSAEFQMSTAISAIYKTSLEENEEPTSSADASRADKDLYKILAETNKDRYKETDGRKERENKLEYTNKNRDSGESDFSQMESEDGDSSARDSYKNKKQLKESEEDGDADYSSDDFEGGENMERDKSIKPKDIDIPIPAVKKIDVPIVTKNDTNEKLTKEEIERRQSFELIKQRWLTAPVEIAAAYKEKAVPPPVTADSGSERVAEKTESSTTDGIELSNDVSNDKSGYDDSSVLISQKRDEEQESGQQDVSMISRNWADKDSDRVLLTAAGSASSRYEYPDADSQSNSEFNSQSHLKSADDSLMSQSEPIGMRLLTTIGSASMVSSFPAPFPPAPVASEASSKMIPSKIVPLDSTVEMRKESERPTVENASSVSEDKQRDWSSSMVKASSWSKDIDKIGLKVSGVRSNNMGSSHSEGDMAALVNRQSVTNLNENDQVNKSHVKSARNPSVDSTDLLNEEDNYHSSNLQNNEPDEGNEGNEGNSDDERFEYRAYTSSHLNQPPFSQNDPLPINFNNPPNDVKRSAAAPVRYGRNGLEIAETKPDFELTIDERMNRAVSIKRSTAQNSNILASKSLHRSHESPWPHEIPMAAPSTEELHAQLAMIDFSSDRRTAAVASVKAKASNKSRAQGKPLGGWTTMPNNSAVNRLEQGNARLSRQYETLQREVHSLRSKDKDKVGARTNVTSSTHSNRTGPSNATGSGPSSPHGKWAGSRTGPGTGIGPSSPRGKSLIPVKSGRRTQNDDSMISFEDVKAFGDDKWGSQAMETMQKIVESGAILAQREKALRAGEEGLRIKEALIEEAIQNQFGVTATANAAAAAAKVQQDLYMKERERVHLQLSSQEFISQHREQELVQEIGRLKARLFESNRDLNIALEKINIAESKPKIKDVDESVIIPVKPVVKRTMLPVTGESDEGGDITIKKSEYKALLAEGESQEILIAGFQKENEKLIKCIKSKENEDNSVKANFFDQQEGLNKEVNRLRNMVGEVPEGLEEGADKEEGLAGGATGGTETGVRTSQILIKKSAETLRAELDKDSFIRSLRERAAIAEAGAGVREKEMQQTIEKLRKTNRQLAATSVNMTVNALEGNNAEEMKELNLIHRKYSDEIKSLKEKLAWYAENQQLLEESENNKEALKNVIHILKTELKKKGVSTDKIQYLTLSVPGINLGSLAECIGSPGGMDYGEGSQDSDRGDISKGDISVSSLPNSKVVVQKPKYQRNPGDVKKIKELEIMLIDLQESIRKRNPDSLSNLIRATTLSDGEQMEKKAQLQLIDDLKAEVLSNKEEYGKRLRSLRQEHERLKQQYEAKGNKPPLDGAPSSSGSALSGSGSSRRTSNAAIKTLPQANLKIKELEDEVEKVRAFYTGRVEEVQRKSDAQIRALKRGGVVEDPKNNSTGIAVEGRGKDGADGKDSEERFTKDDMDRDDIDLVSIKNEYENRLYLVQSELLQTSEELKKARLSVSIPPPSLPPNPPYGTSSGIGDFERLKEAEIELVKLQVMREGEKKLEVERQGWIDQRQKHKDLWDGEKQGMLRRLQDEENRASMLTSEVMQLQMQLNGPKTPQMTQFLAMESYLKQLEGRYDRRERELNNTVEDVKTNAKMERARMQAIHAQECREKDEQLVRFQGDLEQLVYALRQWQYAASTSSPVPSQVTQQLGEYSQLLGKKQHNYAT